MFFEKSYKEWIQYLIILYRYKRHIMLFNKFQKIISKCDSNNIIQITLLENKRICLTRQLILIENIDFLTINREPVQYFIPLNKIKNINVMKFALSDISMNDDLIILLYYDAIRKCSILEYKRNFLTVHGSSEGMIFFDHVNFRKISLEKGELLYCDENYFEKSSSWIESVGGSIPLFGLTLGWKRNLYKYIEKQMSKKCSAINDIADKRKCIVKGYISIIKIYRLKEIQQYGEPIQKEYEPLKMDGKEWMGAIISNELLGSDTTDKLEWTMVYFVEDFLMLPIKMINLLDTKVRVYGEVIKCDIHTDLGDCNCFIKVRGMISE